MAKSPEGYYQKDVREQFVKSLGSIFNLKEFNRLVSALDGNILVINHNPGVGIAKVVGLALDHIPDIIPFPDKMDDIISDSIKTAIRRGHDRAENFTHELEKDRENLAQIFPDEKVVVHVSIPTDNYYFPSQFYPPTHEDLMEHVAKSRANNIGRSSERTIQEPSQHQERITTLAEEYDDKTRLFIITTFSNIEFGCGELIGNNNMTIPYAKIEGVDQNGPLYVPLSWVRLQSPQETKAFLTA